MSIKRLVIRTSVILFLFIGAVGLIKKWVNRPINDNDQDVCYIAEEDKPNRQALEPEQEDVFYRPAEHSFLNHKESNHDFSHTFSSNEVEKTPALDIKDDFPNIDRIFQLFTTGPTKLPIVQTITYSSSVPWQKGKPAWIADYANFYKTSRHFIARSLNGKPDYMTQKVSEGSRFNVFSADKNFYFYLLVDLSRCKMGFYYIDKDTDERVLIKTYPVGVGRIDPSTPSGTLTPLGKYSLGEKIAVYKPDSKGYFQDQKIQMVEIFGTRWLPFKDELEGATTSAKGYGIHGAPWVYDQKKQQYSENKEVVGKYDSDGCIRLKADDVEELFSIVISRPTVIEIVKDFHEAKLPGVEVASPTR